MFGWPVVSTTPNAPSPAPVAPTPPFCYIVLAHRDVEQVLHLADSIRSRVNDAEVLLAYNGALDESAADALGHARVRRVGSGRTADWGGFNLLESTLEALTEVPAGSWAVLVSGDSHPVGDLSAWQERVLASGAGAVLDGAEVGQDPMMQARVRYRWRVWLRPHGRTTLLAFRAVSAVGARLGPRPRLRVMPEGISVGFRRRRLVPDKHVKGSLWFAVGPEERLRLLELSRRADVQDLFRDSLIPDESFVHTLASMDGWAVLPEPVMFVVWPYDGSPRPRQLGPNDAEAAVSSGAAFARKLEGASGQELADLLDSWPRADAPPG